MSFTEDHLLDGRISYRQPAAGHRTGIEPILLAAAIPAKPGQSVLEAGTGAGAALLALAWRVPGIAGIGLEIDAEMVRLAAVNFRRNQASGLHAIGGDLLRAPFDGTRFDHVLANPPWYDTGGTPSPDPLRARARHAPASLLGGWIAALAGLLRPKGTISLILPAASLGGALAGLVAAQCGMRRVLPLWPREDRAAKLFIVRSQKCAQGPDALLPGLILHEGTGGYTEAAARVLRRGDPLMQ